MRKNLKITFESTDQADFALKNGFNIGDFRIDSTKIQREDFVQLRQCFKCFHYNHFANKCNKTPLCSVCSKEHSFKVCPDKHNEDKFKCAVCGGPHWAIAASCPTRKAEIRKMKDERKAQTSAPSQPQPQLPNPAHFPNLPSQPSHPTPTLPSHPPAQPPHSTPAQPLHPPPPQLPAQPPPTIPPAQTPLLQPTTPHSQSNIHHFLPLYIEIWKSIAEKLAGNDLLKYIQVFNAFLEINSCPSFKTPDLVKDLIKDQQTPVTPLHHISSPNLNPIISYPNASSTPPTHSNNNPTPPIHPNASATPSSLPIPKLLMPSPSTPLSSLNEIVNQTIMSMSESPLNVTVIEKQQSATPVSNIKYNPFSNPPTNHSFAPSEYSTDTDSDAEVNISQISASSSESTQQLIHNTATSLPILHPSTSQVENLSSASNLITAAASIIQADTTERRTSSRNKKKKHKVKN